MNWLEFKFLIDTGVISHQYVETPNHYQVFGWNGTQKYEVRLYRGSKFPIGADKLKEIEYRIEFETLYKSTANREIKQPVVNDRGKFGLTAYHTGRSDDFATGTVGTGDFFSLRSTVDAMSCLQLIEHHTVLGGIVTHIDGDFDDSFDYTIVAKASDYMTTPGAGDYKIENYKFVPEVNGGYTLDLDEKKSADVTVHKVTPVRNNTLTGHFDFNILTNQITVNNSGTGGFDLYSVDVDLYKYAVGMSILGNGDREYVADKSGFVLAHYIHCVKLNNVSGNNVGLKVDLKLYRGTVQ